MSCDGEDITEKVRQYALKAKLVGPGTRRGLIVVAFDVDDLAHVHVATVTGSIKMTREVVRAVAVAVQDEPEIETLAASKDN